MRNIKIRGNNKIFGIGLSKTGTTSLSAALEILGISSIHYPRNLEEVDKYLSASDLFIAINFKKLDKLYPGSKFILTTRDKEEWLESVRKHRKKLVVPKKGTFAYDMRKKMYGCVEYEPKKLIKAYDNHHNNVRKYFKNRPNDLLEMNITAGDSWNQLCKFLRVSVPNADFPRENVLSSVSINNKR